MAMRHTIAGFVKAMLRVAVTREHDDSVAAILQANGCVHNESLSASDAQIGVEEDHSLLSCLFCH